MGVNSARPSESVTTSPPQDILLALAVEWPWPYHTGGSGEGGQRESGDNSLCETRVIVRNKKRE